MIKPVQTLAWAALLLAGHGTAAQDTNGSDAGVEVVEEVIVTAFRRAQALQDMAASASALGADDLADRGIDDMNDIQHAVPSMHFGQLLGEQVIGIRGVSSFNRAPGVAVSLDGIYQARTTTAQLSQLDLERIEVLRGPQGTLYGRNSNGGAVNFISPAPTETFSGHVKAGYAGFDEFSGEAVLSGPLSDRLGFRLAAGVRDMGEGWVENLSPGYDDLMQGRTSAARLKLAGQLTERLDMAFLYARSEITGPMDHYAWVTDNRDLFVVGLLLPQLREPDTLFTLEPRKIYNSGRNDSDRDYDLFGLTLTLETDVGTLKSITARQEFRDRFDMPRDATNRAFFLTWDISNTETLTQELTFSGGGDTFDWIVGAFYLTDDYTRFTHFTLPEAIFFFVSGGATMNFHNWKYESDSKAAFADGTWSVTDRMRVSAGVRHTKDKMSEAHTNWATGENLGGDPVACVAEYDESWSSTTVRAVLQYDVGDAGMAYGSYSQGYKQGGVVQYECEPPYNPEYIDALEIGYKSSFLDGAGSVAAALFYYDYADFQITQVLGIRTFTANAGDASILGGELEFSVRAGERWLLSGNVTLLNSEYKDFINTDGIRPELGAQQLSGNSLNNAPERSLNLGVAYTVPDLGGGALTLRADVAYRSKIYFREFNEPGDAQEGYTLLHLNANWESADGAWRARLFAKNATDEKYLNNILAANVGGGRFGTWAMPRQIGFEVTHEFGR